jgi:hypothetical protein
MKEIQFPFLSIVQVERSKIFVIFVFFDVLKIDCVVLKGGRVENVTFVLILLPSGKGYG